MRINPIELPRGIEMEDLFGDVPVTIDDILLWLRTVVPKFEPDLSNTRTAYYVKWWSVADKIRHAKRSGQWPPRPL